jgi:hypothetical protein
VVVVVVDIFGCRHVIEKMRFVPASETIRVRKT